MVAAGDMCGCSWGVHGCSGAACVVAPGGMCGCCWGACVVDLGGVHGCCWEACMVAPRGVCMVAQGHAWLLLGGHVWLLWGCVIAPGGHGCPGGHAWDMTRYRDTINERAVCILLECILVYHFFWPKINDKTQVYQGKSRVDINCPDSQ